MEQSKKNQILSESAAMRRMVHIAAKLYSESPQLFDANKQQSFLLSTAANPDSGISLPPLPAYQSLVPVKENPRSIAEKTPLAIQIEYETLQADFEKETKLKQKLTEEKDQKLRTYIHKEQEYRERIEEYSKKIK